MEYDYSKLIRRIKKKFKTQEAFAKEIPLSPHSFSKKINNHIFFDQAEILRSCRLLDIPDTEIHAYFFSPVVQ